MGINYKPLKCVMHQIKENNYTNEMNSFLKNLFNSRYANKIFLTNIFV